MRLHDAWHWLAGQARRVDEQMQRLADRINGAQPIPAWGDEEEQDDVR